jgi:hypothetical protein
MPLGLTIIQPPVDPAVEFFGSIKNCAKLFICIAKNSPLIPIVARLDRTAHIPPVRNGGNDLRKANCTTKSRKTVDGNGDKATLSSDAA